MSTLSTYTKELELRGFHPGHSDKNLSYTTYKKTIKNDLKHLEVDILFFSSRDNLEILDFSLIRTVNVLEGNQELKAFETVHEMCKLLDKLQE